MDIFRLMGRISIESDSAIKEIQDTAGEAEKAEGKMSKAFNKVGAVAVKVAKAGAIAAGTALVATTTKAVKAYADYEQLVGGVETLFKDSSGKLMEYANNAYKTAGLSANEYMETVTSFSASLLQSLGGDTEAAADYADMAITDMSDNANKMGTSMEMIQNAYQGFAKQNYTMLDNLKLGYGGTQEEMQRLLADAEAISGIKYDISSYADVVDAIHVIQTEMGITGTTAKEASQTISGSIAAAKSAWQNFLVGMADGSQNMDVLVENLASSVVTVGKNLIPRITTTLKSIGTLLEKYVPIIVAEGVKKLKEKVPEFLQAGLEFTINLAKGLMAALPELIKKIPVMINQMSKYINSNSSKLLPSAFELIKTLGLGLIKAIPTLIANIPKIIAAIVKAFTSYAWGTLGKTMIKEIGNGIKAAISNIKSAATNAKNAMLQPIEDARDKIKAVIDKIKSFFNVTLKFNGLKMPHINLTMKKGTGVVAKAAKLLGLSGVPKFSVDWYAKGGIFSQPTIIPTLTGMKGVGEAGAEAVAPIDTLQQYVASAVASQNTELVSVLNGILSAINNMDSGMYKNIEAALDNRKIQWNDRELGRLVTKYAR